MLPFPECLLPSSSTRSVGVSASFCSTASASHGASVSPPAPADPREHGRHVITSGMRERRSAMLPFPERLLPFRVSRDARECAP